MTLKTIETVEELNISNLLESFEAKVQPILTKKLDKIDTDFNQDLINQIVLWKVNRYAEISESTMKLINNIKQEATKINMKETKEILKALLETKGVGLPMASTILRFRNPKIYQIIDQRVFRFIYKDKKYFKPSTNIGEQVEIYLEYILELRNICKKYKINFQDADRVLYQADKEINKGIKIKY